MERDSLLILGRHVTLEAGTGCVHTAPGHGEDDFYVGREYGLEVISPIDNSGCFTEQAGKFKGLYVHKANQNVIDELQAGGMLLKTEKYEHQYPFCWRCKQPIIFRATDQWFASIDGFRQDTLKAIDEVEWIPGWGRERIYNMVRDRGDWCISGSAPGACHSHLLLRQLRRDHRQPRNHRTHQQIVWGIRLGYLVYKRSC